ncbi:PAS domain-containing protein, partial [Planomonospora parontospora]|uniref:PAS domain-containing protein n=1 Tax=Planomonospora parontospora TaxID=58119 RepID=UPI00194ECAD7
LAILEDLAAMAQDEIVMRLTSNEPHASAVLDRVIVITDAPLTVPDTRADERWRQVEAARDGRVTSYAGMPLRAGPGQVLGTLCVIDAEPRQWSGEQLAILEDLAAMAQDEIVMRLTSNEPHASAVLDRVPEPIACLDAAGVVTGWNAAAVRLFGWSAAEAVGRPVSELISPERVRGDCERLLRGVRQGDASAREVHRLELAAADRAGREFPAELVAQVHAGPICQVVLHDVGDRDEIRRQLEGEQLFLRALVDSLDVKIGACDSDGRVVLVNQPLRQGTHAPWPEVHVQDAGEVFEVFTADGRTPLRGDQVPLARALAGEHIDGQQIIARLPGEEPRCFAVNGRPIDAPGGRRLGAVVALHDITAQHRVQVLRSTQHAVAQVLADAASAQEAAGGVVAAVTGALGWTYGEYWQVDEDGEAENGGSIASIAFWSRPGRDLSAFTDGQPTTFARGQDLPGLAWERGEPVWIGDMAAESRDFSRLQGAVRAGLRSAMALPVRSGGHVLGVLIFGTD